MLNSHPDKFFLRIFPRTFTQIFLCPIATSSPTNNEFRHGSGFTQPNKPSATPETHHWLTEMWSSSGPPTAPQWTPTLCSIAQAQQSPSSSLFPSWLPEQSVGSAWTLTWARLIIAGRQQGADRTRNSICAAQPRGRSVTANGVRQWNEMTPLICFPMPPPPPASPTCCQVTDPVRTHGGDYRFQLFALWHKITRALLDCFSWGLLCKHNWVQWQDTQRKMN